MIRINDRYGVLVDSDNYTLVRIGVSQKGKNAGEETTSTLGFYGTLDGAVYAALDKMERDELSEQDMDLEAAVTIIRRLHRNMKDTLKRAVSER